MLGQRVGRGVRFLRIRAGWRQSDLARRAGISRELVSRIERGLVETVTVGSVRRLAEALGSSLAVDIRLRGEYLDRLVDAGHAALQEAGVHRLRTDGWRAEVELSFNHYGDRGRIDLLGLHEPSGILLVVEVKTRIVDVQDMLGRLDVKVRLGTQAAVSQGWPRPRRVLPCLVVADTRSARRIVASHPELFARFNLRGRAASRWFSDPEAPGGPGSTAAAAVTGLLLFEKLPDSHGVTTKRAVRRRKVTRADLA